MDRKALINKSPHEMSVVNLSAGSSMMEDKGYEEAYLADCLLYTSDAADD